MLGIVVSAATVLYVLWEGLADEDHWDDHEYKWLCVCMVLAVLMFILNMTKS